MSFTRNPLKLVFTVSTRPGTLNATVGVPEAEDSIIDKPHFSH